VRQPDLEGRVAVRFVISGQGAVASSAVDSSTLGDPQAEQCVARAVQRIGFPQTDDGGVVIVTYPFLFQPAE
jgi:TonB family protein